MDVRATPALMVFSDDWGRHPSSCQHLVRHLRPGYQVWWVNTIGMRRPGFDRRTFRRGLEKAGDWLGWPASRNGARPNPLVLSPRMWPCFSSRLARWLNRHLLLWQLGPVVRRRGPPVIGLTTVPIVADLMGRLPLTAWVYYCVDDFSQWPGLDHQTLALMEERVARHADALVAVSEELQQRLARWDRESHLLTHGVDLEHWRAEQSGAPVPQLPPIEPPMILFWGLIDRRMDAAFLARLSADLGTGTIALCGPLGDHDPALWRLPRVVHVDPVGYEQLPLLARRAAVLIMPYADLPVTRAMQPLKMKEYLATGRPVVARDLPATRAWSDALDLARSPEEFSAAVRRRLEGAIDASQAAARGRLVHESWAAKAQQLERWILGALPSNREEATRSDRG